MKAAGFSIIELAVVLVLMGVLVGSVTWTMIHHQRVATFDEVVAQLQQVDALARIGAQRLDRSVTLRFDLNHQTVRRVDVGRTTAGLANPPYVLPQRFRITTVQTARLRPAPSVIAIPIGPTGRSDSYALALTDGSHTRRLLIAGMTGQITVDLNVDQVNKILALRGHDAH